MKLNISSIKQNKKGKFVISFVFAFAAIGAGFFLTQIVYAAWTGPTANPPLNNPSFWTTTVSPPAVYYGVGGGKVGIGTSNPGPALVDKSLDVVGDINANRICIAGVCKNDWGAVGGLTDAFNKVANSANTTQFTAVGGDRIQFESGSGLNVVFTPASNRVTYNLGPGGGCAAGEVLKSNGPSSWICAGDSTGAIANGTLTGQTTFWNGTAWTPISNLLINSNSAGAPGGFDANYRLTVGNSAAGSTLGAIKAEVNGTIAPALYLNNAASGGLSFDTGSFQLHGVAAGSVGTPGLGNGRMYYDSTNHRFKCWEGNPLTLKDCITPTGGAPSIVDNPSGAANTDIARIKATADTFYRLTLGLNSTTLPQILFGSGIAAGDLRLYRSGANTLVIDNGAGGAANLNLVGGSYQMGGTPGATVNPGCAAGQFLSGTVQGGIITSGSCSTPTGSAVSQVSNDSGAANSYVARMKLVADTTGYRVNLGIDSSNRGILNFGAGATSPLDAHLFRVGIGQIQINDYLGVSSAPDTNFRITTNGGGIKADSNNGAQPTGYFNNLAVNSISLETGPMHLRGVSTLNAPTAPAAGDGRIFYDSTLGKFRCWENAVLKDCVTAPSGGGVTGSGSIGQAAFWTGAGSIGGDNNFFWDNTLKNLGIGTSTPGAKLHVNGNAIFVPGGTGGNITMGTPGGESGITISGTNRADVRFDGTTLKLLAGLGVGAPASASGIAINTAGNVGIGDITPLSALTVGNGDLFQVNTSGDLIKVNNVTYGWPGVQGAASTVLTNNGSGTLSWTSVGGGSVTGSGTANYVAKFTGANTLGNSQIFDTGLNVGIGTASPGQKLDVNGNVFVNDRIYINGVTNGWGNSVINGRVWSSNSNIHLSPPDGFNVVINDDYREAGGAQAAGGGLLVDGRVGIGTATPNAAVKLEVSNEVAAALRTDGGQFRMLPNTTGTGIGAMWRNDGGNTYLLLTANGSPYGTWNALRPFYVNNTNGLVTFAASVSTSISGYARGYNGTGCGLSNCFNTASSDSSASYNLSASFSGYISAGTGIIFTSDQRLKNFIGDISPEMALDSVMRLKPLMYTWKPETGKGTKEQAGFFAQDVINAVPEAVIKHSDVLPDQLSLDFNTMTTFGLAAIKGLNEKVDLSNKEQQDQIDILKAEINALRIEVDALKASH